MIAVILMLMTIPSAPAPKPPEIPARPAASLRVITTHRFPGVAVCEATQVKRFGIWTTIHERCRTEVVPKDITK